MADIDPLALKRLAIGGIRSLFGRQVITQLFGLIGGIILARVLGPAAFGTYAIITFVVSILTLMGDLGLTASFIQRQEELSERHLQLSFTVQFILVSGIVFLINIGAPFVFKLYPTVGLSAIWLTRVFALSLYFAVFRSIGNVQLERHLKYSAIARADIAESIVYQIAAVCLALSGLGIWSFVLAALMRGLVGNVVIYRAACWPIRFWYNHQEAMKLIRYGLAFQAGGFLNAIGSWATPSLVGMIIGPQAVGYLGMASANARRPLMIIEATMRVSFPHFSRLQNEPEELQKTICDYIGGFTWIVSLWLAVLYAVGRPLIILVYSSKWEPAVTPMLVLAAALPLDVIAWTMGFSYAAVNRNWIEVRIVGLRSILMLAMSAVLVPHYGMISVPIAYLISNLLTAPWLLSAFAPGFLQHVCAKIAWIALCLFCGAELGRLTGNHFLGSDKFHLALQVLVGALTATGVFLAVSYIASPARYRDKAMAAICTHRLGLAHLFAR